jgi:hypothetical protein
MTTYAQIVNSQALNVVVGDDLQTALSVFVAGYDGGHPGVEWEQVPDGTTSGTKSNGDGTYSNPPEAAAIPRILSKTAFQDYVVSQLGGDTVGMARFTEIMDATRDSSSGAVRFAFARYEAALTFEKTNTATLTEIMAGDDQTGHLTSDERTAILDNWPPQ